MDAENQKIHDFLQNASYRKQAIFFISSIVLSDSRETLKYEDNDRLKVFENIYEFKLNPALKNILCQTLSEKLKDRVRCVYFNSSQDALINSINYTNLIKQLDEQMLRALKRPDKER